jgi:hypothetical protein
MKVPPPEQEEAFGSLGDRLTRYEHACDEAWRSAPAK